jgi:hypothetical protein
MCLYIPIYITNLLNGPACRNRTHIHGVEDRCIIHYTKAGA